MRENLRSIFVYMLTLLARAILWRFKPKLILVTGSIGKTSTKDALYSGLKGFLSVRKSEKSYNSELGVPLTIIGAESGWDSLVRWAAVLLKGLYVLAFTKKYPEWLILEVGADRPNDLQKMCLWLKPDVVVTSYFPSVAPHVEFFSSTEALFFEESFPALCLKEDGILIINDDDERARSLRKEVRAKKIISYGLTPTADVRSTSDNILYAKNHDEIRVPTGMEITVDCEGLRNVVTLKNAVGVAHVFPVLASVALASALKISPDKVTKNLNSHDTPQGRMRIIEGIRNSTIIDDTYNSSPSAATSALLTLGRIETKGRRIAVLGDMKELGDFSKDSHIKIGQAVSGVADLLITIGVEAKNIAEGALGVGFDESKVLQFDNALQAGEYLDKEVKAGDVVLIKGSQSMRMEKTVEEIMLHPEWKKTLLVRQDKNWMTR